MKPIKLTRYESVIVVEGSGPFPIDMLRYDACIPATELDAGTIARTFERDDVHARVALRRLAAGDGPPTVGRWESFGWRIVEIR